MPHGIVEVGPAVTQPEHIDAGIPERDPILLREGVGVVETEAVPRRVTVSVVSEAELAEEIHDGGPRRQADAPLGVVVVEHPRRGGSSPRHPHLPRQTSNAGGDCPRQAHHWPVSPSRA